MGEEAKYDIAIIGGGLAGLSLAILSVAKGYSVALIEKEEYPFHKVCGEYISLESWSFLERLDVPLKTMDLPLIKNFQTSDVHGNLYNFKLPLGGFGVSRHCLDDQLYNIALQKGVHIFTNTKAEGYSYSNNQFIIQTTNGTFSSTVLAGCHGKRSNIDVKLNRHFVKQKPNKLNNYIGIKYHINYNHNKDAIALHNFKNGYCGISAIENGRSCLCYLTTASNLKQHNNSIVEMEKEVLHKNPCLKKIFNEAAFLYEKPLVISAINFNKKTQVEQGMIMIGDAAGMITPLCGNGMSMALHGSKIAFEAIHLFLQNKISRVEMEEAYTKNWQKQFEKRLWIGRTVQSLFGGNRSTSIFLASMNAIPAIANQVIKLTHGKPF